MHEPDPATAAAPNPALPWLCLACLLAVPLGSGLALGDEKPRPVGIAAAADAGWADALRLYNGEVELVVAPGIARVVHFGLKGRPNVFRLDDRWIGQRQNADMDATGQYKDFGGAKLWVAPQAKWATRWGNWPPRYALDSGPCRLERSADGRITLHGRPDAAAGVAFARTIGLKGPTAEIEIAMTNVSPRPVAWGIWTVACVKPGGTIFLPSEEGAEIWSSDKGHPTPEHCGWKRMGRTLVLDQAAAKEGGKVFSKGKSKSKSKAKATWIGSIHEGQALLITFRPEPAAPHPPGEGFAEVYSCKKFVELEHVGRLETLKPGERAVLREQWHVFPAPPASFMAAERAAWISAKAAALGR